MEEKIQKFRSYILEREQWTGNTYRDGDRGYRKKLEDGSLAVRYVSGRLKYCQPQGIFHMLKTWEYRSKYDQYFVESKVLERKDEQTEVIRMVLKYPGMTPREFIFDCTTCIYNNGETDEFIILCESVNDDLIPFTDGYIRGKVGLSGYLIRLEDDQTIIYGIKNKLFQSHCSITQSHSQDCKSLEYMFVKLKKAFDDFERWSGQHQSIN